jgi:hypothetical protein
VKSETTLLPVQRVAQAIGTGNPAHAIATALLVADQELQQSAEAQIASIGQEFSALQAEQEYATARAAAVAAAVGSNEAQRNAAALVALSVDPAVESIRQRIDQHRATARDAQARHDLHRRRARLFEVTIAALGPAKA